VKPTITPAEENRRRIVRPSEARVLLGISRTTLYRLPERGLLPPPVRITNGAVGWPLGVLLDFLDSRSASGAAEG